MPDSNSALTIHCQVISVYDALSYLSFMIDVYSATLILYNELSLLQAANLGLNHTHWPAVAFQRAELYTFLTTKYHTIQFQATLRDQTFSTT